jgi:hypothetical protein
MLDRTKILRGPAKITFNSQTFFSRGDVTVTFATALFDKASAAYGRHGQGVSDKRVTVAFTPVTYTAAQAAVLCPYPATAVGASIYGAADSPMVITPISGQPLTIANAAVTTLPNMRFSAIQALWSGDVTLTGLCANNADPALPASYYTWGTLATGVNIGSDWLPGNDLYLPYVGTRGGTDYQAREGFAINFNLNLSEYKPDNLGTVDMFLIDHTASLSFIPAGNTEAEIESLVSNFGLKIGAGATPADWVLAGPDAGDLLFTLKNATPAAENTRTYGQDADRFGELTFEAQRSVNAGAPVALYSFGTVPQA